MFWSFVAVLEEPHSVLKWSYLVVSSFLKQTRRSCGVNHAATLLGVCAQILGIEV